MGGGGRVGDGGRVGRGGRVGGEEGRGRVVPVGRGRVGRGEGFSV